MRKLSIVLIALLLSVSCAVSEKTPETYTVTLEYDEGKEESFRVIAGEKFVLPESTWEGRTILNFREEGGAVYSAGDRIEVQRDLILTAVLSPEKAAEYFSLAVISNEHTIVSVVEAGTKYTLPVNPEKKFAGWSVNGAAAAEAGTEITVTSDTTVIAVYEDSGEPSPSPSPASYAVVVINKGELIASSFVETDTQYTLPSAPEGGGFAGWKVGNDENPKKPGEIITITGNTLISAVWTEYAVGDRGPGGGFIFYVNPSAETDGWKYLEAAATDMAAAGGEDSTAYKWGPEGIYGTETGIGSGKSNTDKLIRASEDDSSLSFPAARACADYSGGGYSDWFLPSRDELNLMYVNLQRKGLGNFESSYFYWSSSEKDSTNAYEQRFSDGFQEGYGRNFKYERVRPVRKFI